MRGPVGCDGGDATQRMTVGVEEPEFRSTEGGRAFMALLVMTAPLVEGIN